jgi:ribosome-binding protein aMBF1 (putative translation factor)
MVLVDDRERSEKAATKRRRRPQRAPLYESATFRELQHEIGAAVVELRQRHGWTQEEAAHAAGMGTRLWQRVENAEANLSLVTLARVLDVFQVEPAVVVHGAMREIMRRKPTVPRT